MQYTTSTTAELGTCIISMFLCSFCEEKTGGEGDMSHESLHAWWPLGGPYGLPCTPDTMA